MELEALDSTSLILTPEGDQRLYIWKSRYV